MEKVIKIIYLFLFLNINLFSQTKAILQLDTGGHKARIWDIAVTSDSRFFITASDDKTVRVWDVKNRREVRKILGQIGSGSTGMVFAIDLTADDRYLAVGGCFENNVIRIYDFSSGKIVQILRGHSNVILNLSFSECGNYLVSGSMDKTVAVWKKENNGFKLFKKYSDHSSDVYNVKIFKEFNEYRIISAGYDKKIYLYSLKSGLLKSYSNSDKLAYLAVSKRYIAACGKNNKIKIFDRNLNLIRTIFSDTQPTGLVFSPDSKYLLAGHVGFPPKNNVYNVRDYFKKVISFNKQNDLTQAVAFLNNRTVITGGGDRNEIYLWDIHTGNTIGRIVGKGRKIWSVGINGNRIAYGHIPMSYTNEKTRLEKVFDIKDFSVDSIDDFTSFTPIPVIYNNFDHKYSIQHTKGGKYGYSDAVLQIIKDNRFIERIVRGAHDGYEHRTYGFMKQGLIISGGNNGHLKAYNLKGKLVADFIGHTGTIWSVASDGSVLVSGSSDQTIKYWNIENMTENNSEVQIVHPMLNIFISEDDEWVVWSNSGYYNSSIGGDRFVGYHVNRGFGKSADYFRSDRFFRTYYQPDVINNILKLKNEEKAIAFISNKRRIKNIDIEKILPPLIRLNMASELVTYNREITVDFEVKQQSEYSISGINIFVNGREIKERGMKASDSDKYNEKHIIKKIPVPYGSSVIKILARNRFATSNPVFINIERRGEERVYRPNLYVLSVGVSKYDNSNYDLDYAALDAEAVINIFKDQNKLYQNVSYRLLTNEKAKRGNILDGIDWLINEATQKDVVIMFIAGHGVNDEFNNYYFLGYDSDADKLRRTAVKWVEFKDIITNLPSKVIFFVDACHAGNILGGNKKRGEVDIITAIKDLIAAGTGQIIMTATTDNAAAYEDPNWQHGAFTKALTDGLKNMKADFDKNDIVTIKELDYYITKRVKELTNGHQRPTTIVPESIPDFPIVAR